MKAKATVAIGRPDHTWYEVEDVPIHSHSELNSEVKLMEAVEKHLGSIPFETSFVHLLTWNVEN